MGGVYREKVKGNRILRILAERRISLSENVVGIWENDNELCRFFFWLFCAFQSRKTAASCHPTMLMYGRETEQ